MSRRRMKWSGGEVWTEGLLCSERSQHTAMTSGIGAGGSLPANLHKLQSRTSDEETVVLCPVASAPSKARLCQLGAGPGPGSLGQAPGTKWCVAEGNDGCEAYTGR